MDCRFANIYSVKRQFEGILSYGRGAYKKEVMGQINLISVGDKKNKKKRQRSFGANIVCHLS